MSRSRRGGMVLVLVAGVLMLLLLAGVALLETVHASSAGSGAALSACRASLAAESGADYAASRLLEEDGHPRFSRTPADRGDDWVFRDGATTLLADARNPSYSHGGAWTDDPAVGADGVDNDDDGLTDERDAAGKPTEGAGRREGHEAAGPGPGGDGRWGACSGRLRGGRLAFRLKIESVGAKIPVNLGARDSWSDQNGDGFPDRTHHAALVCVLNNLGAIRIPPGGTRRYDVPASGEPVRTSWLGVDLVRRRPRPHGYRSREDLRERMRALGYAPAECDAVLPFLDLGPYETQAESGMPMNYDSGSVYPVSQVEYATAEPRVLQALWMHLRTRVRGLMGEKSAWAWYSGQGRSSPRTGIRFSDTGVSHSPSEPLDPFGYPAPNNPYGVNRSYMAPVIFPDEALELARVASGLRESGTRDPESVHFSLISAASQPGSAFAADVLDLTAEPVARAAWIRAKIDLAVLALTSDLAPAPGVGTWCSRGVPFDPMGTGAVPFSFIHPYYISRVPYPSLPGAPYADDKAPYQWGDASGTNPQLEAGRRIRSIGWTFGPATRFRVESMGLSGPGGSVQSRCACQVRALERLDFTAQEDFEALGSPSTNPSWQVPPGKLLAERGIRLLDPAPAGRRPVVPDPDPAIPRAYPHLVTLPRSDPRGFTPPSTPSWPKLSRFYGAIGLAGRERGPAAAGLYWPVSHDYDGTPASGLDTDPATGALVTQDPPTDLSGVGGWCLTMPTNGPGSYVEIPTPWSVDTGLLQDFTVELWANPVFSSAGTERILQMWSASESAAYVQLTAVRAQQGTQAGTRFRLYVHWRNKDGAWVPTYWPPLLPPPDKRFDGSLIDSFYPDDRLAADGAGCYHIALRLNRNETPGKTRFRLFINGAFAPGFPVGVDLAPDDSSYPNGEMRSVPLVRVQLRHVDEVRMYPAQAAAEQSYFRGRFVPPPDDPDVRPMPSYTSPCYELDDPRARLLAAQWIGLTARETKERVDINVYLDAWDAAGNHVWSKLPLAQAGKVHALPADEIRSFQYTVVFFDPRPHDAVNDGPLLDSPLFESIWLSLRRPARLPERHGWSR